MTSTQALAHQATARDTVVVELIGDLDVTLASLLADTLADIADGGVSNVYVTTRHVSVTSPGGLEALDAACGLARDRGCSVTLEPGNRRMRTAFANAHVAYIAARDLPRPPSGRHLMIARHAPAKRLLHTV